MNNLYLYWYKIGDDQNNFGDILGPYLVNKLTGKKIFYVHIPNKPIRIILHHIKKIIKGTFSIKDLIPILKSLKIKKPIITAGSIISRHKNHNCDIWGSGLMNRYDKISNANFYAVRGKITQLRLKELGYKAPTVIGDPGLLLPIVYKPIIKKKYKLGIIPHYNHYRETYKMMTNTDDDIIIINLLDDVEKVIQNINSCNYTISSSLHGIIVSHAYNIPSLWYNLPGQKIAGDNTKFLDYFSSVGIKKYVAFDLVNCDNYNIDEIINNIRQKCDIKMIHKNIKKIQKELLNIAPFPILDIYKNNLK